MTVSRRSFLKSAGLVAGGALVAPAAAQMPASNNLAENPLSGPEKADYSIRIAATPIEIAPNKIISVTTYNGQFPGPLLRFKEGQNVIVDLINETDTPEQLHWHGQLVPVDVDGASEEGTPYIPAHGTRRISFVPRPSGYRFYHTHNRAGADLPPASTAAR